jgi:hypothetical protein
LTIGAFSASNASSAISAAISAAMPQRGLLSSTMTTRPVAEAYSRIVSASSGEVVRGSMMLTEMPSLASALAAALATDTIRPSATIVTSSPSSTISASPKRIV